MRHVWLIIALAAGLVAALALAACGGDDSPEQPIVIPTEATTTGSLDQADFIEEADAICAEANAAIQEYADAGQGVTAAGEIADLRAGVVADIEELGPPADDRETLDEFLAALEAQVEAGEKIALALDRESDTLAFEEELTTAKSEAATAASTYGFEECGSETTGSSPSTGTPDTSGGTVAPAAPVTPAPVAPDTSGGGVGDTGGDTAIPAAASAPAAGFRRRRAVHRLRHQVVATSGRPHESLRASPSAPKECGLVAT